MDITGLADPWSIIISAIILLAAAVYAWKNVLGPAWNFVARRVHSQDRQKILDAFAQGFTSPGAVDDAAKHWAILVDVAKFLEPNGKTLAEHLDDNDAAHVRLFRAMDGIEAKLDGFIVERKVDGRRHYDLKSDD